MRTPSENLTTRQAEILDFIVETLSEKGYPPTVAEIATNFSFRSPNAAASHLNALRKKGYIRVEPRASRGIEVLKNTNGAATSSAFAPSLPIIGRVAAGSPVLAEEHQLGSVALDAQAFDPRPDYWLQVQGDSMVDEGIFEGDLIAVASTRDARNGQIVVARVNDDVTVKKLQKTGNRISLMPANAARKYRPIEVKPGDHFEIEGICVGLIRAL